MTSPIGPADQYATAKQFYDRVKRNTENLAQSGTDLDRLSAYALYEDMYYNRPETFRVFMRGEDDDVNEVYLPSGKKIVEAMNRFLCKEYDFIVPPRGDDSNEARLVMRMDNLFKRERLKSKINNQKRMGLVRGDALLFVRADPSKEQFSRISIDEISPGNYFPITDPGNSKRVIGCHLVEVVRDPSEKEDRTKMIVRRQTYLKSGVSYSASDNGYVVTETTDSTIYYEVSHWSIGKWDDRNMKNGDLERVQAQGVNDTPFTPLPTQITSIPVYHWKNGSTDTLFGNSELAGIETLIAAANQSITDEDLSLVLACLGVYATTSKPPVDAAGQPANWQVGPGAVVEHAKDTDFTRVSGVASVEPYQSHISKLENAMQEGAGIPDIAAGKVDVAVAESGVSLSLQLAPILASSKEKGDEILSVLDHLLYDLVTQWFPAYEGEDFGSSICVSTTGNPLPENREARVQEVMLLFTSGLIELGHARAELAKFGYDFTQTPADVLRATSIENKDTDTNRFQQELEEGSRDLAEGATELSAQFQAGMGMGAPT